MKFGSMVYRVGGTYYRPLQVDVSEHLSRSFEIKQKKCYLWRRPIWQIAEPPEVWLRRYFENAKFSFFKEFFWRKDYGEFVDWVSRNKIPYPIDCDFFFSTPEEFEMYWGVEGWDSVEVEHGERVREIYSEEIERYGL
jgi:hypothetical protein